MDLTSILLVIFVFASWGLDAFCAKLAANRIGAQSSFWYALAFAPPILLYGLIAYGLRGLNLASRSGIALGLLSGALGGIGMIGFHLLISRTAASTAVPLTGLYPALTAVLAILFLREGVTWPKVLGIALSMVAVYLLSS